MSTMNVLVRRKEVSDRGIIQSHTFPSSDHVAKNGLWEFGKGRPILPKHHLDSTVARGSGSRDPVLMGVGKEQKTSLGTRVLHRDHHERLDELPEVHLAGHRLQCLDHRYEIQLLDQRPDRSRGMDRCRFLAEMWVRLLELLYLAVGAPAEIAVPGVPQIGVADRFEAAIQIKSTLDFFGNSLVMHETIFAFEPDALLVDTHHVDVPVFLSLTP